VFTVYDLAQTLKRDLTTIAKTLLIKADKRLMLVVVPANAKLDFVKLKKSLKAKNVSLAKEKEMQTNLNVKPGAVTPFGTIHKLDVVMDKALLKAKRALFGAGSFTESVDMKVKDFVKLVNPIVSAIGEKSGLKLQNPKSAKKSTKKKNVKKTARRKLSKRKK
jgi:Ala-tRNA(Pro) deacylase